MIDVKQLIDTAHEYGATLKRIDHENIKVLNGEHLPSEFIQQLKAHKQQLLEYFEQSFFDAAAQRAYHGYFWLLEHKQRECHSIDVYVSTEEWRQSISQVIGLNACEVQVIENLLIESKCFKYQQNDQYLVCVLEDDHNENYQKLHDWMHTPQRMYLAS